MNPPVFGRTVNPISTRGGADYSNRSATSPTPPGFSDHATALRLCTYIPDLLLYYGMMIGKLNIVNYGDIEF